MLRLGRGEPTEQVVALALVRGRVQLCLAHLVRVRVRVRVRGRIRVGVRVRLGVRVRVREGKG